MLKSPYSSLAADAAAIRAARAAQPRTFRANIGGSFKPRTFDPGCPSTRALDAAADRIARDAADAQAIRDNYLRYTLRSTYRP